MRREPDIEQIQLKNHAPSSLLFRLSQILFFKSKIIKISATAVTTTTIIFASFMIYLLIQNLSKLPEKRIKDVLSSGEVAVCVASSILVIGLIGEWFDYDRWKKSVLYTLAKLFVIAGVAAELLANIIIFDASSAIQTIEDDQAASTIKQATAAFDKAKQANESAALLNQHTLDLYLQLEKIRRPRILTPEQQSSLIEKLRPYGPFPYDVAEPEMMESDSFIIAQLVSEVFPALRWTIRPYVGPLDTKDSTFALPFGKLTNEDLLKNGIKPGFIAVGRTIDLLGMVINVDPRSMSAIKVAKELWNDLSDDGFSVSLKLEIPTTKLTFPEQSPPSDIVHVEFGQK